MWLYPCPHAVTTVLLQHHRETFIQSPVPSEGFWGYSYLPNEALKISRFLDVWLLLFLSIFLKFFPWHRKEIILLVLGAESKWKHKAASPDGLACTHFKATGSTKPTSLQGCTHVSALTAIMSFLCTVSRMSEKRAPVHQHPTVWCFLGAVRHGLQPPQGKWELSTSCCCLGDCTGLLHKRVAQFQQHFWIKAKGQK